MIRFGSGNEKYLDVLDHGRYKVLWYFLYTPFSKLLQRFYRKED
jgi:hypothetical protein